MVVPEGLPQRRGGPNEIRFSYPGFIGFSLALLLAGGVLSSGLINGLFKADPKRPPPSKTAVEIEAAQVPARPVHETPAWGELIVRDIELERPQEYVAYEADLNNVGPMAWSFAKLSREQVAGILERCGLTADQVGRALSPELASFTAAGSVIKPDDPLIFSLAPETREKLYLSLTQDRSNIYAVNPYRLAKSDFEEWEQGQEFSAQTLKEIKGLAYERGGLLLFSDYPTVLRRLPTEHQRLRLAQVLSRESAVLVRVCIRAETDVDKLLGYWQRGAHLKDARPLLESVKRLSGGTTVGISLFLPYAIREKLNTFPLPERPGDPVFNCHWSTMNFFNETPDNSLADPAAMLAVLGRDYYPIAQPSIYGDIMLIRNSANEVLHSALFLAEDVVYTKNGKTMAQPWVLTRIRSVIEEYTYNYPPKVEYYRDKRF
jgi:hypothetical protein